MESLKRIVGVIVGAVLGFIVFAQATNALGWLDVDEIFGEPYVSMIIFGTIGAFLGAWFVGRTIEGKVVAGQKISKTRFVKAALWILGILLVIHLLPFLYFFGLGICNAILQLFGSDACELSFW